MKNLLLAVTAFLLFAGCNSNEDKLIRLAEKLHKNILTVDTHCDTPMLLMESDFDLGVRNDKGCVDFPRMMEGGLNAEFFAVFLGQGPRDDSSYNRVYRETLDIFNAIYRNVEKNSDMAEIALSPADACRLRKEGKIAAFIGIENGYPIAKDISRIKDRKSVV